MEFIPFVSGVELVAVINLINCFPDLGAAADGSTILKQTPKGQASSKSQASICTEILKKIKKKKKHTEKKSLQCKIYTKLIVKFEVAGSILYHNCSYQAWLCAAEQLSAHTPAISGVQYLYALMLHQIILPADMQE